jgi:hypothetical protein
MAGSPFNSDEENEDLRNRLHLETVDTSVAAIQQLLREAAKTEHLLRLAAEMREGELLQELEPYRAFKAALQSNKGDKS